MSRNNPYSRPIEVERDRLRATNAKLKEAFMEYGKHHSWCILDHHAPGVQECGCGFVGILRGLLDEEAKERPR